MLRNLFLTMLLFVGLSSVSAQDLDEQQILLTFIPNIQYAPFYVAIEEGYFADEGLDVTFEYLNEPDIVELIAVGQAEFGTVSGEQVILARASDRPVTTVYEWYQEFPVGVVFDADAGIERFADLADMEVGVPGRFGANYIALSAFLSDAGLTESDIQLAEIGFNAPEVFCVGGVDAAIVYFNNEPLQIRNLAAQGECGELQSVGVIPVSTVANLVSNGIITSEAMLNENPERVQAVVNAFERGLQDTINNPARAYLHSAPYIEGLPLDDDLREMMELLADSQDDVVSMGGDAETIADSRSAALTMAQTAFDNADLIQFEVLLETIKLWETDALGVSEMESWLAMQDTLLEMGLLEESVDLDAAFTNAFVPE